jgi:hypothetical protein
LNAAPPAHGKVSVTLAALALRRSTTGVARTHCTLVVGDERFHARTDTA